MKFTDRINQAIHPFMVKRVCRHYQKKLDRIKQWHPELFKPIDPEVRERHLKLWGRFGLPVTDKWVTWLTNLSGIADYRYAPEDMVFGRVERILNDCNRSGFECEDKNQFFLYVPNELQAKTYLRFVRGAFYDEDFHWMPEKVAQSILDLDHGDMIGKVCVNSLGGHGITKFIYKSGHYSGNHCDRLTTDWIKNEAQSYILQEKIEQCDFSAQFNPHSANSCKIVTLRCPWSGEIKVVKAGMRFGQTQSVFDNLSSGGLCVCVDVKSGELSPTAYNWYKSDPFSTHPLTGLQFAHQVHPHFGQMKDIVVKCAANVPDMNMLSWDLIATKDGKVKILEVNASSQSHDWLQFDFGALFGDYTEQVVDWCVAHLYYDRFEHFRTWY